MHVPAHRLGSRRISHPIGDTPSRADLFTAMAEGLAEVYANSGRVADALLMARDRYYYVAGLLSDSDDEPFENMMDALPTRIPDAVKAHLVNNLHEGQIVVASLQGLRQGDHASCIELTARKKKGSVRR